MRLAHRCAVLAAALLAAVAPNLTGNAMAEEPSYSYLGGLAAQLSGPGQPPPGANDWNCKPTAAHPDPVVLLNGLSNETITWNTLSPVLAGAGYCVFTTTYGAGLLGPVFGAMAPIPESARQIAAFVDLVRTVTGVEKVDLVGHSMGGAVPFYYLNYLGGIPKVDDYIALAAPLHGSTVSGIAELQPLLESTSLGAQLVEQCGPCQLSPGKTFLDILNPDPALAPDIRFTTVVTRYDEIATPWPTGQLSGPNVTNVILQDLCATDFTEHYELTADPVAVRVVLNALDPAHAEPVGCRVVLPFLGPIGG
ncbi:alpha/beta fold hydrolase [Nocardia yamanashiensis]|uniref:esterase/lipase family protein n=1 Tax=Nocardia yamanashiensis TaxID=209247 RepID=UPI001E58D094|nr:alpha/beta fold hydrolase [Nocardia yamanashiensis]UGT39304.1 alpha/beta fold hydrolase [Nocardia yamanashiensis]